MKQIKQKDPKERMTRARLQLLMHFPFFGELVMRLSLHPSYTAGVGTTCVDHKGNLYYHPDWIANMENIEEVMFELAHEVMHLVQRASIRFPNGGNHRVWNMAADIKVDSILIESGLKPSSVSKKNITAEIREKFKGKVTEQIYFELLKNPNLQDSFGKCPHPNPGQSTDSGKGQGQGKPSQGQGNGEPQHVPGSQVGERGCTSGAMHGQMGSAEYIEKFKQYVVAAALKAKEKGKCPAYADEFLAEIRSPSVSWKQHIRRQASSVFKGRYSWHRPSRRTHSIGTYLPSRAKTPNGAIITMDTSGSIGDNELTQFLSECAGILRETGCQFLRVYFHDVECYHVEDYNLHTIHKIKATRGGTSHVPVYQKIHESKDKIGMVVSFTDLYTDFPAEPDFPVIWAHPAGSGDEVTVPWGKKVKVELTD